MKYEKGIIRKVKLTGINSKDQMQEYIVIKPEASMFLRFQVMTPKYKHKF